MYVRRGGQVAELSVSEMTSLLRNPTDFPNRVTVCTEFPLNINYKYVYSPHRDYVYSTLFSVLGKDLRASSRARVHDSIIIKHLLNESITSIENSIFIFSDMNCLFYDGHHKRWSS